jgi:hypothetical protein
MNQVKQNQLYYQRRENNLQLLSTAYRDAGEKFWRGN